ncbi:DUF2490 domain-containing protein [Methylobacterium sp. NEAU 140]|uniref:DUF2490 domain-containing protein n=1 Tax=Methylobacterium sp. NEAU 140 TaxID=3064945 RepID=UPI0027346573|nr:DUF2490 domain-containing protein [Methylobacterium sp. NEAU 140]MDP4022403.1 DUF2490 domain-containing protein [Methylobacterium sp. NEAU 140]
MKRRARPLAAPCLTALSLTALCLTALCLTAPAGPAAAEAVRPGQLWLNTTVFGSLGDAAFFAEVQPRFGNGISQLDQLLLRPAVGWKVNPDLTLYQGYARIEDHGPRDRVRFEDRSFQEINWQLGVIGGVQVSSRTRFEQRWQSYGRDVGFRLRENLRFSVPLTEAKNGVAAVASSEVFVALNDTDWGGRAGFDRVRTFVGVALPIGGKSTFEIGYLNQTFRTPANGFDMDHILALNVLVRN